MHLVKESVITALGLITFLVFTPLQAAHSLWCKFALRQNIPVLTSAIPEAFAAALSSVGEALEAFFPDAQEITEEVVVLTEDQKKAIEERAKIILDPRMDQKFLFSIGKVNGEITGYAAQDMVKGKWGLISYMIALDPNGMVRDVMVLEYREKRGRPVAKRRFLKQFRGKTIDDPIKVQKDIRGVTGASISSNGMTNGIRKMVHIFKEVYGNP